MIASKVEIHCLSKEDIARIIDELVRQGVVRRAGDVGIETSVIASLAARLKPTEKLDFAQAVVEVSNAVNIAVKVVTEGARGSSDKLVDEVQKRIAERTKANDPAGATHEAAIVACGWRSAIKKRSEGPRMTAWEAVILDGALLANQSRWESCRPCCMGVESQHRGTR